MNNTPNESKSAFEILLQNNLVLITAKYAIWLIFKPSAWVNHVKEINDSIDPAFALADMLLDRQWKHLKHPLMRTLLIVAYLVLPTLNALLAGVVLFLLGRDLSYIISAVGIILIFSLAGMAAVSIAFGFSGAITAVLAGGVAITFSLAFAESFPILTTVSMAVNCAVGTALGTLSLITKPVRNLSLRYQALGGLGGILFGSFVMLLIYTFANRLSSGLSIDLVFGVSGGMVIGITGGVAVSLRNQNWMVGGIIILLGIIVGAIAGGIVFIIAANGPAQSIASALVFGSLFASLYALSYLMAERVAGYIVGVVAGTISTFIVGTLLVAFLDRTPPENLLFLSIGMFLLSITFTWWRPYVTYPLMALLSVFFFSLDQRYRGKPRMLFYQPAFWDEYLPYSLPSLEDHILLVYNSNSTQALSALEQLAAHQNGRHTATIQSIRVQIVVRQLQLVNDIRSIADSHELMPAGNLSSDAAEIIKQLNIISRDVRASLETTSLIKRRDSLTKVTDRVSILVSDLQLSANHGLRGFPQIALNWKKILALAITEIEVELARDFEIPNPYVVGMPLELGAKLFVGRANLASRIEDLVLKANCPPLLLFGQRRIGKTSLMLNLQKYLSSDIIPVFTSFQGALANTEAGFLYNLADQIRRSLSEYIQIPRLEFEAIQKDPIPIFNTWLNDLESSLGDKQVLLEFDEVDALEEDLFARGRLERSQILGLFRSIIQHRPKFRLIMGTSLHITELMHWSPYIINMQSLHIGYLNHADAKRLIEDPVEDYPLQYDAEARDEIIRLTRCHPGLIQVMCNEIVQYKNSQPPAERLHVHVEDVRQVISMCIEHSIQFFLNMNISYLSGMRRDVFSYIVKNESSTGLSYSDIQQGLGQPNDLSSVLTFLMHKELIEEHDGQYRVSIELVKLWYLRTYTSS